VRLSISRRSFPEHAPKKLRAIRDPRQARKRRRASLLLAPAHGKRRPADGR
jgi:hypothetical protein